MRDRDIRTAQQRSHFLRIFWKNNLDFKLLLTFYGLSIGSLLTYCVMVRHGSYTKEDKEKPSKGVQEGSEDHWLASPLPDQHLHLLLPQQSTQHHQRQLTPGLWTA
ncbi:hypothetical protein AMECASPLE_029748 [Ameca splendens]|uniref:Alkylated DNA repair protein AlkB homologue 8 N-terminal domain-containing protein n=1 Tax=Ameca splendens TaxID=208324 RepID=A0ABV0XIU1_9TELE